MVLEDPDQMNNPFDGTFEEIRLPEKSEYAGHRKDYLQIKRK